MKLIYFVIYLLILPITYAEKIESINGIPVYKPESEALTYFNGKGDIKKPTQNLSVSYYHNSTEDISYKSFHQKGHSPKEVKSSLLHSISID